MKTNKKSGPCNCYDARCRSHGRTSFVASRRGADKPDSGGTIEVKHGYAVVNGLKMYYETYGAGKPLVVLHGAFGWATNFPTLAKNRQVIAVELQGHGHTADIDRPLSLEQLADDVAALLKDLDIEQADFFGYSMGGNVALAVAIRHPHLVASSRSTDPITARSTTPTSRRT